jgi:hypothetical protein
VIRGNRSYANGQSGSGQRAGIRLTNSSYCVIDGNMLVNENYDFGTETQQLGLTCDGSSDHNTIVHNVARSNVSTQISVGVGASNIIRGNVGLVTENKGTASITSGNTSVTVTHGLGFTPALSQISVTPTSTLASATEFWISSPTSTEFTINVDVNPAATVGFAWGARYS